jgi:hypothetical protein
VAAVGIAPGGWSVARDSNSGSSGNGGPVTWRGAGEDCVEEGVQGEVAMAAVELRGRSHGEYLGACGQ